jgi:hypothetical protein
MGIFNWISVVMVCAKENKKKKKKKRERKEKMETIRVLAISPKGRL